MTTSMNERIHFLIKNISLTLYSRKGDVSCVWEVNWRRGQTAILTPSSTSTIAALLPHLGRVAQPWVTEGLRYSVCRWLSLRHLVLNWLQLARTALGTWLYNCLTYTCFRRSSAYLHRCISWLRARSRVNMLHSHNKIARICFFHF